MVCWVFCQWLQSADIHENSARVVSAVTDETRLSTMNFQGGTPSWPCRPNAHSQAIPFLASVQNGSRPACIEFRQDVAEDPHINSGVGTNVGVQPHDGATSLRAHSALTDTAHGAAHTSSPTHQADCVHVTLPGANVSFMPVRVPCIIHITGTSIWYSIPFRLLLPLPRPHHFAVCRVCKLCEMVFARPPARLHPIIRVKVKCIYFPGFSLDHEQRCRP
jgi:hypothetical protein